MNKKWLLPLLIALTTVIAYHNCLHNEMFWDDDDFILKNRFIRDWQYFPRFFSDNLVAGSYLLSNYWRPVLLTVFAGAWHLWQTWLPGWHSLNIMFHALDGIVLYFLLNRLTGHRALGATVALIFVAHPVHNEAIVYVNSLGDPLATFFVLASLLLFVRFRQSGKAAVVSRNFWFSLLCFPMAVMSKETGFVLCALLPAMDIVLLQKDRSLWMRLRKSLATVWPFLIGAVTYVLLRATVLNFNNSFNFYPEKTDFSSDIGLRLLTFFKACTQYFGFLFFPYQLRVERQIPVAHSLFEWDVLLGAIGVGLMAVAIFKYWRRKPLVSFGCCWFFIAIAPASNVLVPINAVLYEHFLYVPMIGIVIAVLAVVLELVAAKGWQKPALGVLLAALIVFCGINIRRNLDWRTAVGFYEQLVQYAPSYRVINNLGMEYAETGNNEKAEFWYRKALAMDPANPVAYHNIAGTFNATGRVALAEEYFKKAIALDPTFIFSYRSLAELYYRTKNYREAQKYLKVLVEYDPTDQAVRQAYNDVSR